MWRARLPIRSWLAVAGLLPVILAGCSRAPAPTKPKAVFVDAVALSHDHPQWQDVVDMDRQIAWLRGYDPRATRLASVSPVDSHLAPFKPMPVDIGELRKRVTSALEEVHDREREVLERRLERARQRERAAGVSAERAALETEADQRFQEALDRFGETMANLDVKMSVTASLQRGYAARGPQWEELAKQMESRHVDLKAQWLKVRDQRSAAVDEVFDWFADQLRGKESAEAAAALVYRREHQAELDALDASIERQKKLLIESLPEAPATAGPPSPASAMPMLLENPPPLPGPALAARIAALKARRAKMAGFILQNTQAVVKAAAAKQTPPVQPVFRPGVGMPDRTRVFRPFVQRPADSLERLS